MKAIEIRNHYLKFFSQRGHKQIQSASLLPEGNSSVLFTIAGMQPLLPYFLGKKHPQGNRLTGYQKCMRTVDIDEVGDNRHLTYFEMLGNWSLGEYFKEESIQMSFDFLTKELQIPIEKLSVTCFSGDKDAPKDEISATCWEKAGILKDKIYFFGKEHNWWIAGEDGPCGPDTEMFYDTGKPACGETCDPSCDCGKYIEIWNNVFMEYYKTKEGNYEKLEQRNVDTGLGLERMAMLLQGKNTPYETELFLPMIEKLEELSGQKENQSIRIIADHLRSSMMVIADGGKPSNVERGYVIRRMIRRMIRHLNKLQISLDQLPELIDLNFQVLQEMYPELVTKKDSIKKIMIAEKDKFVKTLTQGEREFFKEAKKVKEENRERLEGKIVFRLYDTYGFPPEVTKELAEENDLEIDLEGFEKLFREHQEKSRAGAEKKFKGGIAEQTETTIAYHTATHLLHQALKQVLGEQANQKGSNITEERLRFDFTHGEKMTKEQLEEVEKIVNEQIQKDLMVTCQEMSYDEAKKSGAIGLFTDKYGEIVKVYQIGDFSKEICGGPHVNRTGNMGTFKIKKEESSSSGVRRIKAILIK